MLPVTKVVGTELPALATGGGLRRLVLSLVTVATWSFAGVLLGAGIAPGGDEPLSASARVALVVAGLVVLALPVLLLYLPARRRSRRMVDAVLDAAAAHPPPELPAFDTWAGPERMFRRLFVSSLSYLAIPLLLLVGWSVACAVFLDEGGAALVFAAMSLIPLLFLVVTVRMAHRMRSGVSAGLVAGQLVRVSVDSRIDQKMVINDAFQSWFDARLPDGQHVVVRTPLHFTWAAEARGVLDDPDLVLVIGRGGHQGVLLAPSRPEDAVWLLGPVPVVRAGRGVQRALSSPRATP